MHGHVEIQRCEGRTVAIVAHIDVGAVCPNGRHILTSNTPDAATFTSRAHTMLRSYSLPSLNDVFKC